MRFRASPRELPRIRILPATMAACFSRLSSRTACTAPRALSVSRGSDQDAAVFADPELQKIGNQTIIFVAHASSDSDAHERGMGPVGKLGANAFERAREILLRTSGPLPTDQAPGSAPTFPPHAVLDRICGRGMRPCLKSHPIIVDTEESGVRMRDIHRNRGDSGGLDLVGDHRSDLLARPETRSPDRAGSAQTRPAFFSAVAASSRLSSTVGSTPAAEAAGAGFGYRLGKWHLGAELAGKPEASRFRPGKPGGKGRPCDCARYPRCTRVLRDAVNGHLGNAGALVGHGLERERSALRTAAITRMSSALESTGGERPVGCRSSRLRLAVPCEVNVAFKILAGMNGKGWACPISRHSRPVSDARLNAGGVNRGKHTSLALKKTI